MRIRWLAVVSIALVLALGSIALDASARRAAEQPARAARRALAARIGLADLALSSGARWLRHPSQVEPAAPLADAPGALDVDPAGAWVGVPRPIVAHGATWRVEVRRSAE